MAIDTPSDVQAARLRKCSKALAYSWNALIVPRSALGMYSVFDLIGDKGHTHRCDAGSHHQSDNDSKGTHGYGPRGASP
jgi:hypothetical protein